MNAPETKVMTDAEFQESRRTYLGGSDAAAVFGVSPWATPLDIYLRKRGEMPATGRAETSGKVKVLKRGKRAEPVAIDMLEEDLGIKITRRSTPENPNRYVDPEFGFLAAEIDFEWEVTQELADVYDLDPVLIGTIQNGEVKSVDPRAAQAKFGEEGTDEIPIEYAAQAMHGLMVTGREVTMFAVLAGWDDLTLYWIKRDDETVAAMREKEVRFWLDNVVAGVHPEPVNLPDVYHLFSTKAETKIEATPEMAELVNELMRASDMANSLSRPGGEIDQIKFKLGTYMLGAEQLENPTKKGRHLLTVKGTEVLSVNFQQQTRLDQAAVKEKYPEVVADCTKAISFFVYRPKRSKSK